MNHQRIVARGMIGTSRRGSMRLAWASSTTGDCPLLSDGRSPKLVPIVESASVIGASCGNVSDPDHVNDSLDAIAESTEATSLEEARERLGIRSDLAYIRDDTFTAHPEALLGRVFYIQGADDDLDGALHSMSLTLDDDSVLEAPLSRQEVILSHEASAGLEALSFISTKVAAKELYELRVIDNAAARAEVVGTKWDSELKKWMNRPESRALLAKPGIKMVAVVTGVVQKYVSTKKFKEFEGNVKGGAYGVNVDGRPYCSSSFTNLDIVYGISLQIIFSADEPQEDAVEAQDDVLLDLEAAPAFQRANFSEGLLSRSI